MSNSARASTVHIKLACACMSVRLSVTLRGLGFRVESLVRMCMHVCPSICHSLSVYPSVCFPIFRLSEALSFRFTSGMTAGENLKIERRPMLGEISRLDVPTGKADVKGAHNSASKRVATHVKRKVDPVRVALLQQYDMWSKER